MNTEAQGHGEKILCVPVPLCSNILLSFRQKALLINSPYRLINFNVCEVVAV